MKKININSSGDEIELYSDVCHIIEDSRQRLATTIDKEIEYAVRTQLTWTQLPDKNLLSQKLHKAIAVAREHYQSNEMEMK